MIYIHDSVFGQIEVDRFKQLLSIIADETNVKRVAFDLGYYDQKTDSLVIGVLE